jgi:hypothetical protein
MSSYSILGQEVVVVVTEQLINVTAAANPTEPPPRDKLLLCSILSSHSDTDISQVHRFYDFLMALIYSSLYSACTVHTPLPIL